MLCSHAGPLCCGINNNNNNEKKKNPHLNFLEGNSTRGKGTRARDKG